MQFSTKDQIFRDLNFPGQNKLIFTKDIIIFYLIASYHKLLYSALFHSILLYDTVS